MVHLQAALTVLLPFILGVLSSSTDEQICADPFVSNLNYSSREHFDKSASGVQLLFPDLQFNCSGQITAFHVLARGQSSSLLRIMIFQTWEPVDDGNSYKIKISEDITSSVTTDSDTYEKIDHYPQTNLYVQSGNIVGVFLPRKNNIHPLPLLYSSEATEGSDGSTVVYYGEADSLVCKVSLCSQRFQTLEGVHLQLQVSVDVTAVSGGGGGNPICSNDPKFTVCQDSGTTTAMPSHVSSSSTYSSPSLTSTPNTTICEEECENSQLSLPLPLPVMITVPLVLFIVLLALLTLTVVLFILHKRRLLQKSTETVHSSPIEHYQAQNGSVYTAVSPRRESKDSLPKDSIRKTQETDINDDEVDGLQPYAELRTIQPVMHQISVASTSIGSPQVTSPIAPYAASMFNIADSPAQNPRRTDLSLSSSRPPHTASLSNMSGCPIPTRRATVSGNHHFQRSPHPYVEPSASLSMLQRNNFSVDHIFSHRDRPATKIINSTSRHASARSNNSSALPILGEGESLAAQPYQEPMLFNHPGDSSNFGFSKPNTLEISPFPYCELQESPLNTRKSPMSGLVQSHANLQKSNSVGNPASPYLEPSPKVTTKRKKQALVGKLSVGLSSGIPATSFIYTLPEAASSKNGADARHQQTVSNSAINLVDDDSVYSRLDRNTSTSEQALLNQCKEHKLPTSPPSDLYDTTHPQQKYREIPRESIYLGKELGSGHFGTVYHGIWSFEGGKLEVAVKTLKPGLVQQEKDKFLLEATIMGQFLHSNVVKLHGVVSLGEPLIICLELMSKGDLKCYLKEAKKNHNNVIKNQAEYTKLLHGFCYQIAKGMSHLASKEFVHRDLAARNVFLNDEMICKIGDFGMSRDLAQDEIYESKGGEIPLRWTAPEALNYKKYTIASDRWSYGMLLFEIWSLGCKPFHGKKFSEVLSLINSSYCQPPPPGCPKKIYELMVKCWNHEPSERPTFLNIVEYLETSDTDFRDPSVSKMCTVLGAPLDEGKDLFPDLQRYYD